MPRERQACAGLINPGHSREARDGQGGLPNPTTHRLSLYLSSSSRPCRAWRDGRCCTAARSTACARCCARRGWPASMRLPSPATSRCGGAAVPLAVLAGPALRAECSCPACKQPCSGGRGLRPCCAGPTSKATVMSRLSHPPSSFSAGRAQHRLHVLLLRAHHEPDAAARRRGPSPCAARRRRRRQVAHSGRWRPQPFAKLVALYPLLFVPFPRIPHTHSVCPRCYCLSSIYTCPLCHPPLALVTCPAFFCPSTTQRVLPASLSPALCCMPRNDYSVAASRSPFAQI